MKHPIVIIGAGFTGMIALKTCKEEGLDAICFEKADNTGGLWRFRDSADDGDNDVVSTARSTVLNTSKEMCAMSDFPPPPEYPNYMHHSKYISYLEKYVEHFKLLGHIRFEHQVIKVSKAKDYEKTGEWTVTVQNKGVETMVRSSAVMVCVGHHNYPNVPTFPGQSKFSGVIMHTQSYKDSSFANLNGKNVLVVGIGNSAADVATELSYVCNQVYISTRRGSWLFPRLGANGMPADFVLSRYNALIQKYFPKYHTNMVEKSLSSNCDLALYNLKPRHRFYAQHPTITDFLATCILYGTVMVKGDISYFTEKGVVFKGEEEKEYEVNFVILATGYEYKLPFLDKNDVSIHNNKIELYNRILPPNLTTHPTLAVIGMIQPNGPIIPVAELQSRWFLQVFKGKIKLPSKEKQLAEINEYNEINRTRYVNSARHTIEVDFVTYSDKLAMELRCKPNLFKLFFTDHKLFRSLLFGPSLPYQFRLTGPNAWSGARRCILTVYDRMKAPFNTKVNYHSEIPSCDSGFSTTLWRFMVLTGIACIGALYVKKKCL